MKDIANKLPPEISESEYFKRLHTQIESLLEIIRLQASEDSSDIPEYQIHPDKITIQSVSNYKEDQLNAVVQDNSQNLGRTSTESNGSSVSYAKATHQSSSENGSGSLDVAKMEGQKEVIEQFEPGVYVTVIQLANGTKIFKRVRFRYVGVRLSNIITACLWLIIKASLALIFNFFYLGYSHHNFEFLISTILVFSSSD